MGAVCDFVDMTLNSTQEPQLKDEPTLNRSLVPKPRQDLIVTRNPLDFAKMHEFCFYRRSSERNT